MHIFSRKSVTKKIKIQRILNAPLLYVPLLKSIGEAPQPIVKVGDEVYKAQMIGEAPNDFSANVHAPVSGTIVDIKEHPLADGILVQTIIIKNDFEERVIQRPPFNISELSAEDILSIIRNEGIVGEGGAQFPTVAKYELTGGKVNTFIINGTECEPYLTADYSLMAERTEKLFKGIAIANRVLDASDIVISIEEQNKELSKVFEPFLQKPEYNNFRVAILPNEYPQGGELQLVKSITNVELPRNKRPREVGIIVSNVGTIYAIYKAVVEREPVISRIITISGEELINEGNYEIKIGTPVGHIIKELGISTNNKTVVLGGPMMGKAVLDWSAPITKGSSGVLFFHKEKIKRDSCISCGYCVEVCPMNLMPMKFEENYRRGKYFNLEKYSISSCIECAACEYACPSNVPLIESIKEGKIKLKQLANAIQ